MLGMLIIYVNLFTCWAEKCLVEDPRNSLALLEKASHCVTQAIQRIPHDGDSVSCCDIFGVLDEECNLCGLAVS